MTGYLTLPARWCAGLLAGAVGLTLATQAPAASVTTDLSFSANQGLFGGSSLGGLGADGTFNYLIGTLDYDVGVNSGTVTSNVNARLEARFDDTLELSQARDTRLQLLTSTIPNKTGASFSSTFGAKAFVSADLFGLVEFDLVDEDRELALSDTNNQTVFLGWDTSGFIPIPILETRRTIAFGDVLSDDDTADIAGVGPDNPLLSLSATARIEQESTLSFGDLVGSVVATHTSGARRSAAFSLGSTTDVDLSLDLAGDWALALEDVTVENTFSSTFGFLVTGEARLLGQGGSLDSPTINFADVSPFSLNFGLQDISLGAISVQGDPVVSAVPLPAGLPMMIGALALFGALRRRAR